MRSILQTICMCLLLGSCEKPKTDAERYPGQWKQPTTEVAITLGRNKAQGCGEFYQKPSIDDDGEYVVACSEDGLKWTAYLVWTHTDKILGPDQVFLYNVGGPPNREKIKGKPFE